jgi:hypothetical protein
MGIDKIGKTWSASNAFCIAGGAKLASIHSTDEHTALMSLL